MNRACFYLPQPPWFFIAVASYSDITNFGWSLGNKDSLRIVVRFLRGKKMTRLEDFHNEFAAALQFPYYYGENWPAFDECLNDLDWLLGDAYILIVTDAVEVLSKENTDQFCTAINILQNAAREWSEPGDILDRSALPFHVIFQCSESEKVEVVARLQLIPASYKELNTEKISIE